MGIENTENKKINKPQRVGKDFSKNLMDILDMGETPNLDGYDILPNKVAYDLIEEGYGGYVIHNINKFNKTSQLFNRIIEYCEVWEIIDENLIDSFTGLNRSTLETMLWSGNWIIDDEYEEGWKKFGVDEITRKRYLLCADKFGYYKNERTVAEDEEFLNTLCKRSYDYYFSQDDRTINQLREKYIRNGYSTSE